MSQFKEITLNLESPLDEREVATLNQLNKNFKDTDFKVKFTHQSIQIFLNEINFNRLKQLNQKLSTAHQLDPDNNPMTKIISAIEKIGSYGIKGKRRLYVDYNKERKVKNRNQKERKRGQFFYAASDHFKEEDNPLPKRFENKIICDDSENVLAKLPDNCIDLVFTSPPYNFGLDYEKTDDDFFWQKYFDKLFRIFDQCIRVLKFGGRIIVNIQPLFSDYIPSHHMISNFFIDRKLIWKGEVLWEKNNYNCKYTAWGSWKSPSNPYLKYTWEFIEIFCKGQLKKSGERSDIDISADDFKKWVVAKWSISPERKMKRFGHPAMFPEELVKRVVQLFSYKNDIILDPFNGVGTTTYVASAFERRYLGIDISEEYCKKAEHRIAEKLL